MTNKDIELGEWMIFLHKDPSHKLKMTVYLDRHHLYSRNAEALYNVYCQIRANVDFFTKRHHHRYVYNSAEIRDFLNNVIEKSLDKHMTLPDPKQRKLVLDLLKEAFYHEAYIPAEPQRIFLY